MSTHLALALHGYQLTWALKRKSPLWEGLSTFCNNFISPLSVSHKLSSAKHTGLRERGKKMVSCDLEMCAGFTHRSRGEELAQDGKELMP